MQLHPRISRTVSRAVMASPSYETWSREELIARLKLLDATLPASRTHHEPTLKKVKPHKDFNFASYPRRKIALKFCYAGWEYNGLAFQKDKTPLPTVEATLYSALASCRLIDPDAGPEGCGWERCGRTDRGVSSAGQVVSLWVRSNVGQAGASDTSPSNEDSASKQPDNEREPNLDQDLEVDDDLPILSPSSDTEDSPLPLTSKVELKYISMLNRVLPPTIRMLAWSPISPEFSSRFACQYRHYKYFFSAHGLDLEAMQDAASRLIGEHDFRNLCKLDAGKQITNFKRRILRAEINPAPIFAPSSSTTTSSTSTSTSCAEDSRNSGMHVFDLAGTAFLYNQVRHIVAILFLVGSGLEPPSVVSSLINTDPANPYPPFREGEHAPEIVECKPEYQMADPLPLVLWDCKYRDEDVNWQTDEEGGEETESQMEEHKTLYHQMHAIHQRSLIHTTLDAHFLRAASVYHPPHPSTFPLVSDSRSSLMRSTTVLSIPLGGGMTRRTSAKLYTPILQRKRLDHVDIVNERWRVGKGGRRAERKAGDVQHEDEP